MNVQEAEETKGSSNVSSDIKSVRYQGGKKGGYESELGKHTSEGTP